MAVIKNDTFTEASDTGLESHTSDSGGGWEGADANNCTVVAATNTLSDEDASDETPICDEANTETDYFAEIIGATLGGTADTDRIGVFVRGDQDPSTGTAQNSTYYTLNMRGDDGWRLQRVNAGSITNLDFDTGYVSANSINGSTSLKMKLEVSGTGALITLRGYIDPDGGGYDLVSSTGDTDAGRITTAGKPGVYIGQVNARISEFNAEDNTSSGNPHYYYAQL